MEGGGGWTWGESGVGAWAGLVVGVGLNSKGEARVNRFYAIYMGHTRGYRGYQLELAVQCLLYATDAVILRLGGTLTVPAGT